MTRRVFIGAAVLISGFALAGCGGQVGGSGTPTPSSAADGGVPSIPQPELDAKKYLNSPCGLVTAAQRSEIGSKGTGDPTPDPTGTYCSLSPADGVKGTQYIFGVTSQNTLSAVYQNRSNIPVFRPGTIAGYPSVSGNSTENTVAGNCQTFVGIAQDLAVTVHSEPRDRNSADYQDACPSAEKLAAMIVNNIKGGK